jgi:hypothetical protein
MVSWLEGSAGCGVSPGRWRFRLRCWRSCRGSPSIRRLRRSPTVSEFRRPSSNDLEPSCCAGCCHTPDRLIESRSSTGHVWIRFAGTGRPPRPSAEEGPAPDRRSGAAGRAGSDEHGALARALDKLRRFGAEACRSKSASLGARGLRRRRERAEIDYDFRSGGTATTRRSISIRVPRYTGTRRRTAIAEDERLFRLDRIRAVRPTGERFDPLPGRSRFRRASTTPTDDPRDADLDPGATWVVESYLPRRPRSGRTARGGSPGGQRAGLAERLLLDLGPAVWAEPAGCKRSGRSGRSTLDATATDTSVRGCSPVEQVA